MKFIYFIFFFDDFEEHCILLSGAENQLDNIQIVFMMLYYWLTSIVPLQSVDKVEAIL